MNTKINVVDIECTCWIDEPQPEGEVQEIIEIGIAQLDLKTLEIEKSEGILVRPSVSRISTSCTQLTSITPDMVELAPPFSDAVTLLEKEWNTHWFFWASYGEFDRTVFERQCENFNVNYPFGAQHINVKAVIRSVYPKVKGLGSAIKQMNMEFDGRPHRGVDDARNIALLYAKLIQKLRE